MFKDDAILCLHDKRYKFQVEIRRQRTESLFQLKRAIFVHNKDLELLAQFSLECFNRKEYQKSKDYLKKLIQYADSELSENLKSLNTINYLKDIAQTCDSEQFSLILEIFLKICLPQCLCPQLLNQIQDFYCIEIVNQFIILLQKIVYMNEIDQLIEQHDIIQYLLDITLELDDFKGWFLIVEQLCNYQQKPSLYFKNLIIPCFKLLQYDSNQITLQVIESMCNCKTDRKGAINYLLIIPGFIDLLIINLYKSFNIISHIIEQSDDGILMIKNKCRFICLSFRLKTLILNPIFLLQNYRQKGLQQCINF